MKITLTTLEKGITGQVVITPNLENMFQAIYKGNVPDQWLKSITTLMLLL